MILYNESDALEWLRTSYHDVPRETWVRLGAFGDLLRVESGKQNLVSIATLENFHLRHVVDSVQLLNHGPTQSARWLDLGSGAGFPGLMIALFSRHQVSLVESRRLRVEFLERATQSLGVAECVDVIGAPIERVPPSAFDVISARAFAPLPRLLALAHPFSTETTRWVLPKGRSAQSELEQVLDAWQGDFRLAPSLTDPDARIIVAEGVCPRAGAGRQRRRT
jgi:16S rRNA (guanine527-N7)-methyltransferase